MASKSVLLRLKFKKRQKRQNSAGCQHALLGFCSTMIRYVTNERAYFSVTIEELGY